MAAIGIDLGTTNSVAARLDRGKAVPIAIDGHSTMPSVVLFHEGRVVVGHEARNLELLHPQKTIRSVKRRMGSAHRYEIEGRSLAPEEVSAEVLRALKAGAERELGEPVTDAVITVPAYFDDAQRRATLRAGELAGLQVLRLLNEPTSAALCYEQLGLDGQEEPELILVYDLGGGTFDVSVLEVFQGTREVRATNGNSQLGGDDFDDKLLSLFIDALKTQHGVDVRSDVFAMARLRRAAEHTKIALSGDVRAVVREEFVTTKDGKSIHLELEVSRRAFEDSIAEFIDSTVALSKRAVADAGLDLAQLSRICLVGGSTRIPLVRARLEATFGLPIHEEIDPDLAVGLGARIQAAMLRGEAVDRVLVDVAAHTLGVRVLGEDDDDLGVAPDTFAPILRRNTVLPALRVEEFYTLVDEQEKFDVEVFQGEHARVSQNTPVGSFTCPLAARPAHSPVRIAFNYDLDGVVRVTVSQPGVDGERVVELSVPDASRKDGSARKTSAVERRAKRLSSQLPDATRGELDRLLGELAAAQGEQAERAEEAVLDFLLEHEPDDESEESEAALV